MAPQAPTKFIVHVDNKLCGRSEAPQSFLSMWTTNFVGVQRRHKVFCPYGKKLCGGREVTSDARRRSPEPLGIGRMLVRQLGQPAQLCLGGGDNTLVSLSGVLRAPSGA